MHASELTCKQKKPAEAFEQSRAEMRRGEEGRGKQSRAEQSQAEQSGADQSRAQSRAEQIRAEQSRGEERRGEESRAEQSRAEQSGAEQSSFPDSSQASPRLLPESLAGSRQRCLAELPSKSKSGQKCVTVVKNAAPQSSLAAHAPIVPLSKTVRTFTDKSVWGTMHLLDHSVTHRV